MEKRWIALLLLSMGSLAVMDDARAQHPEQLILGAADPSLSPQAHEVRVTDLTPRFLAFYDAAQPEAADEARHWELWKEHYDFAALPPVPGRDSLAREMLEAAWPRYPEVIDCIRRGAAALEPSPDSILRGVTRRLEVDEPVSIHLLVFVGNLEGGAFFAPTEDELLVALPIEEPRERRMHGMAHEFTHEQAESQAIEPRSCLRGAATHRRSSALPRAHHSSFSRWAGSTPVYRPPCLAFDTCCSGSTGPGNSPLLGTSAPRRSPCAMEGSRHSLSR